MDMRSTITPKSDQINYDDFLAGSKTITITGVKGTSDAQQPVTVNYEGDNGKPYKPCKSMRRVMVQAWGADATKYVGRSMTLYGDPNVTFGGSKVGGIRISHMSHIEKDMAVPLTMSKARRAMFPVKVLKIDVPLEPLDNEDFAEEIDIEAIKGEAYLEAGKGIEAYKSWWIEQPEFIRNQLIYCGHHDICKKEAETK